MPLLSFYFSKPIIFFSSICYSRLNWGLAPPAGHRVSEPGLRRPGKTRWSQTNKKAKAPTPRVSQSGSCQRDIKGTPATQSPTCLPFSLPLPTPCLHLSPPFQRYIVEMTEPSPNAPRILPPSISLPLPPTISLSAASPHGLGFRMKWELSCHFQFQSDEMRDRKCNKQKSARLMRSELNQNSVESSPCWAALRRPCFRSPWNAGWSKLLHKMKLIPHYAAGTV